MALYIKIASLSSLSLGWKEQLIKMQLFHYFGQGVGKKNGELQGKARWEEPDLRSFSKERFFCLNTSGFSMWIFWYWPHFSL